jgi:tetratricopeptide (TPR) repeat protein
VLVLWSEHSGKSNFVKDEADKAQRNDKLISVRIGGDPEPPIGFRQLQVVDMAKWDGHDLKYPGLRKILAGITHKVRRGGRGANESRIPDRAEPKESPSPGKIVVAGILSILAAAAARKYLIVLIVSAALAAVLARPYFYTLAPAPPVEDGGTRPSTEPKTGDKASPGDKASNPSNGNEGSGSSTKRPSNPPTGANPAVKKPLIPAPPSEAAPATASTAAPAPAATAGRGCASLITETRKRPDVSEGFFELGKCHYDEGYFNDAVIAYNAAIEINAEIPKYLAGRALAKWKNNSAPQGIADLDSAIGITPRDASLYESRGQIRFAMRDWQRAMDDYGKATSLNPKSKRAWLGLAAAAEQNGAPDVAESAKATAGALP